MRKITICSSVKFKEEIASVQIKLTLMGYEPLFPEMKSNFTKHSSATEKHQLAEEHFASIKKSDAVYFLTVGGYMGTSCKLELGYAIALNKPIYFTEATKDDALDCWAKSFVPIELITTDTF